MDQRLQYETIIAGKLENLPVPDMQDMIWARIKADLDTDMPEDDGGSDPSSPSGPGIMGWGLSVILIALITVFFLLKDRFQSPASSNITLPNETIVQPEPSGNDPPPGSVDTSNSSRHVTSPSTTQTDNITQQDALTQSVIDSNISTNKPPDIVIAPPKDTIPVTATPATKKPKGVSGITNDDYRIVPKSDSAKKQ